MTSMPNAPSTTATASAATEARQAYENGMPLHVLRRRFHLSDSEAQDVAPEEFEHDEQADSVSGY